MSGHSKWSKIKRKKEGADKKRGQLFSKFSKTISSTARAGGDPDMNPSLKLEIDRAKSAGMNQDTIERAIRKGTGEDKEGGNFAEIVYEAYGPGGAGMMIRTATDNRNRTSSNIKHLLAKFGGKLGSAGSVGYIFGPEGVPTFTVDLDGENRKKLEKLIEELQESEDVIAVRHNARLN